MTPLRRARARESPRVLHVMWTMRIGGAERAVYQLVLAQRAAGMEAGVMVASELGLYGQRLVASGVPVECLGQRRGVDVLAAARARTIFAQWDVVHFHVAEPPLMLGAALSPGKKYYTHRAGAFRYPFRKRVRYQAAGVVLRRYDGVVGNTAHAANVAVDLFGTSRRMLGVVYNGIEWDLLQPERSAPEVLDELELTPSKFALGTTGNLRDWKRVDFAIRAIARARSNVTFVVVGDGPERKRLERLTRDLNVEGRVRFAGKQSNIADYLQVLDAFVLPSGPEESFGNSAVEAMGFGLPTIVFEDGGGLKEHVVHEQTGVIVKGIEDLAAWIDRLAADEALRTALGDQARVAVRAKYTIERMVGSYSELYSRGRGSW